MVRVVSAMGAFLLLVSILYHCVLCLVVELCGVRVCREEVQLDFVAVREGRVEVTVMWL